jgi:hypothetical protein
VTLRSRPAQILPYLLAFVLGVGAAGLAACGNTNKALIPAVNGDALKQHLDAVGAAIDNHDCTASARAIAQVKADLAELPRGTSVRLQSRLEEGIAKLEEQAGKECVETTATTDSTTTQTTQSVTTEVPPTTTTDTTATTPPTTPPTTPTTVPTTPDSIPTTTDQTGGAGAP